MTVAVATRASSLVERMGASPEIAELIRAQIAPEAPDDVIALYFARCQQLGVDPLGRMMFVINRQRNFKDDRTGQWNKVDNWQLQGSVDLFRAVAASTTEYAGQDGPFWCGEDGKWTDVWLRPVPPAAAKVGVFRHGFVAPLYATAVFAEYCQTNRQGEAIGLWKNMPATMVAKCAEALALRKAFPAKLTGIYTGDEMAQAENTRPVAVAATTTTHESSHHVEPPPDSPMAPHLIGPELVEQILAVATELGADAAGLAKAVHVVSEGTTETLANLLPAQGEKLLRVLQKKLAKKAAPEPEPAAIDPADEVRYCESCGAQTSPEADAQPHEIGCPEDAPRP